MNVIVDLPIKMKGNPKPTSGNFLSPLGTQKKNLSASSQKVKGINTTHNNCCQKLLFTVISSVFCQKHKIRLCPLRNYLHLAGLQQKYR